MYSRKADFNHFAVKHLVLFWQAGDRSEAHLEDDISTSVLDEAIIYFPVAL